MTNNENDIQILTGRDRYLYTKSEKFRQKTWVYNILLADFMHGDF